MTINTDIFTFLIQKVLYIWNFLDSISIAGFSLLDLCIVIVLVGAVFPALFNLYSNSVGGVFSTFENRGERSPKVITVYRRGE